jgi:hypothetical protein
VNIGEELLESGTGSQDKSEPEVEKEIVNVPEVPADEGSFRITKKLTFGFDDEDNALILGKRIEEEKQKEVPQEETAQPSIAETEEADETPETVKKRIPLSSEFSDEIDEYMEKSKTEPLDREDDEDIANSEFVEYESEVRICNNYLSEEMTKFSEGIFMTPLVRKNAIHSIMETSQLLEERSRNMSFEIISNVYQAIFLSFEKISEGKYDISESTVALLRQGLELIDSLIRGEDYFVYKSTLKSIENIRNNLLEEKKKKEEYSKRVRAKEEILKELSARYPQREQKLIVSNILSQIRNIESVFRSVEYTDGSFHTYESLKILSGSVNNFKNIVPLSKELELPVLAQLSEAGYNFVKYLCNYRKDPAIPENKEILDYLVYSLKSLLLGREIDDTELFISYLNDPVRIFSKQKDHLKNHKTDE